MLTNDGKYGILLSEKNIKLNRMYFEQMIKLIGINVIYRAPKQDKHWTTYAEIESNYQSPVLIGCIFNEHPDQKTMKKMGWASELQDGASIISVPYDLKDIQVGSLFIVPSAYDDTVGRLFRVIEMSTIMIYPASITCQIVPEYMNTYDESLHDHRHNSLNLLNEEGTGIL